MCPPFILMLVLKIVTQCQSKLDPDSSKSVLTGLLLCVDKQTIVRVSCREREREFIFSIWSSKTTAE